MMITTSTLARMDLARTLVIKSLFRAQQIRRILQAGIQLL